MGHTHELSYMLNVNSVGLGGSVTPLGMYAGYLLLHSGNFWIASAFLALTGVYFFLVATTLCRYAINYRRNKQFFQNS